MHKRLLFAFAGVVLALPSPYHKRPPPPAVESRPYDLPTRDDIITALGAVRHEVRGCGGPGTAFADIQFEGRTGRVTHVTITGAEGDVARCVIKAVQRVAVPPFKQASFTIKYPFKLGN